MADQHARNLIRVLVGAALCAALAACIAVPIPEDLPTITFRLAGLYRLEVALLVFYGGLLLATPAFSGLIRGRLPIEISMRGAKFAEETERSEEVTAAKVDGLEKATDALAEGLFTAHSELEQIREGTMETVRNRG